MRRATLKPISRPAGIATAIALLLAVACSRSAPQLQPIPTDGVIVAFGDSLTAGVGASANEAYPAVLETLIAHRVVNAGVSGEETSEGLERLPGVLDEYRPALVILCEGGNDLLRRRDPDAMERNLETMVRLIRASGAQVMLVGVPHPALLGLSTDRHYSDLAVKLKAPIETEALPDILSDRSRKSDQIHPNAAGYRDLARAIAKALHKSGAIG